VGEFEVWAGDGQFALALGCKQSSQFRSRSKRGKKHTAAFNQGGVHENGVVACGGYLPIIAFPLSS
jgi:hypothetical protein